MHEYINKAMSEKNNCISQTIVVDIVVFVVGEIITLVVVVVVFIVDAIIIVIIEWFNGTVEWTNTIIAVVFVIVVAIVEDKRRGNRGFRAYGGFVIVVVVVIEVFNNTFNHAVAKHAKKIADLIKYIN